MRRRQVKAGTRDRAALYGFGSLHGAAALVRRVFRTTPHKGEHERRPANSMPRCLLTDASASGSLL
jgi:hypothetical protein